MATNTLGNKFTCFMCQCRFYDLNRPDPVCPKCNANQKEAPKTKPTPSRARAAERVPREEVYVPVAEEPEAEEETPGVTVSADDDETLDHGPEPDDED